MEKQNILKAVFEELRHKKVVKNQSDFAKFLCINATNLSSALNGKVNYLTDSLFCKIAEKCPQFNPQWLLTGQGSMLRTDTAPILSNNTNSNVSNTINDSTLIDALSEQLRVANEQLRQKDEQLKHAHEQLTEKDKQISQLFALLSAK